MASVASPQNSAVVTRFAPSPTGYLHVGGARTALFSWLLARHHGANGRFLLRIEDTDLARSTPQATLQLVEDLQWLGLHWDNSELVHQSRRLEVYNQIIDNLLARGLAYHAYETSEELDALRRQAEREKRSFVYRRPLYTDEQVRRYRSEGRTPVVRFAMPVRDYSFDDAVIGNGQGVAADKVQDLVIRKGDGMPTYHFAVVVDDAEMGVTHVLRGQEHLLNTVSHIALQEALGYPRPAYAHLPIILNLDGSKMGKRDRDKAVRQHTQVWLRQQKRSAEELGAEAGIEAARIRTWLGDAQRQLDLEEQRAVMRVVGLHEAQLPEVLVHDFRRSGYLPEAMLNFLALLGWNPGQDRERLSRDELIAEFSLDRVGASNSKFDRAKLLAFNTEALAAAPTERLVQAMRDCLSVNAGSPLDTASNEQLGRLIDMKRGVRVLGEIEQVSRFFFLPDEQIVFDPAAVEKVLRKADGQGLTALRDVRDFLAGVSTWDRHSLEAAVQRLCDQQQLGLGKVAQPIRLAISGSTISPPIFESLEFLGRQRTLTRIDRCLDAAGRA
jgi:glutamyl-tRNA synthetase